MQVYQLPRVPKGPSKFCRTPAAEDMVQVIDTTIALRVIGTIITPPGGGKTTTLRHYTAITPGARYCVMNAAQASTMAGMLGQVCEAIDAPPVNGAYYRHRRFAGRSISIK